VKANSRDRRRRLAGAAACNAGRCWCQRCEKFLLSVVKCVDEFPFGLLETGFPRSLLERSVLLVFEKLRSSTCPGAERPDRENSCR